MSLACSLPEEADAALDALDEPEAGAAEADAEELGEAVEEPDDEAPLEDAAADESTEAEPLDSPDCAFFDEADGLASEAEEDVALSA